jgi:cytosine/uracil/thiamine/allantoin permease
MKITTHQRMIPKEEKSRKKENHKRMNNRRITPEAKNKNWKCFSFHFNWSKKGQLKDSLSC